MKAGKKRNLLVFVLVFSIVALAACQTTKELGYNQAKQEEDEGDFAGAITILKMLSRAGDSRAQFELGRLYLNSNDTSQGLHYWNLAADNGNVLAMNWLAAEYATGKRCRKNAIEAYKLFGLTALAHDPMGAKYQRKISREMSPAQIAEGNRRILNYLATHPRFKKKCAQRGENEQQR